MTPRDYFLTAMKAGRYQTKRWVIEAFTLSDHPVKTNQPWMLERTPDGYVTYGEQGESISLDGLDPKAPAFSFHGRIDLKAGEIPNLKESVVSSYGNVLANYLLLVYPFGDLLPYQNDQMSIGRIEREIEARLIDDPDQQDGEIPPGKILVKQYLRFAEAANAMAGYAQLCVPSATVKTMTTDPAIVKRRAELLKQYKDRLDDPVVQTLITNELIRMDRAWVKGDDAEGFYRKDKSYDVVRKKTFLLQGAEHGFGVQGELISTSLDDGWRIENLPAMGSALRDGSFSRGALTALGGEATKFNYRIFQNTTIAEEDCGSTFGLPIVLYEDMINNYVSSSVITPKGIVEITEENKNQFVGKSILIRSPAYCKTSAPNFCAVCIGKRIAQTPTAISSYAASVGSTFMKIMLGQMHAKALRTHTFDIHRCLT